MDDLVRQRVDEILREKIAMGAGIPAGGVKAGVKAGVVIGGARKKYPSLKIMSKGVMIGKVDGQTKKTRENQLLRIANEHHEELSHGRRHGETAAQFNERARAYAEKRGVTIKYAKCHLGAKIKACEEHRAARTHHAPAPEPKKKRKMTGSMDNHAREYAKEHGVTLAEAKCKMGSQNQYCRDRKYSKNLAKFNIVLAEVKKEHPDLRPAQQRVKASQIYQAAKAAKAEAKGTGDMGYGFGHDNEYAMPNRGTIMY